MRRRRKTLASLGLTCLNIERDGRLKRAAVAKWLMRFGENCPTCGVKMWQTESGEEISPNETKGYWRHATVDHILARALGGDPTSPWNMWVICAACNHAKSVEEMETLQAFAVRRAAADSIPRAKLGEILKAAGVQ